MANVVEYQSNVGQITLGNLPAAIQDLWTDSGDAGTIWIVAKKTGNSGGDTYAFVLDLSGTVIVQMHVTTGLHVTFNGFREATFSLPTPIGDVLGICVKMTLSGTTGVLKAAIFDVDAGTWSGWQNGVAGANLPVENVGGTHTTMVLGGTGFTFVGRTAVIAAWGSELDDGDVTNLSTGLGAGVGAVLALSPAMLVRTTTLPVTVDVGGVTQSSATNVAVVSDADFDDYPLTYGPPPAPSGQRTAQLKIGRTERWAMRDDVTFAGTNLTDELLGEPTGTDMADTADTTGPLGAASSPATSVGVATGNADTTAPLGAAGSPATSAGAAIGNADTTGPLGPSASPARSTGNGAGVAMPVGAMTGPSPARSASDASTAALGRGVVAYAGSGLAISLETSDRSDTARPVSPLGAASSPATSAGASATAAMGRGAVAYGASGLAVSDETTLTNADTTAPLGAIGSPARSVGNAATAADTTAPLGAARSYATSAGAGGSNADTTAPLGGVGSPARSVGDGVFASSVMSPWFGGIGLATSTSEDPSPLPVDATYVFDAIPVATVVMDDGTVVVMDTPNAMAVM